jgi:hypothetical protein
MTPAFARAWILLLAGGCVLGTAAALLAARQLLADRSPDAAARLERNALHCARACYLLLGLALAAGAVGTWLGAGDPWPWDARNAWLLAYWAVWFTVLHVHRVKAFKGRTAAAATLVGWALGLMAFLGLGGLGWLSP